MKGKEENNTEQAILEAAEKVFIDRGYALAKTTEIARIAGVNHAMLHYYFRTKENLFDKVFRAKVEILANSFSNVLEQDLPFFDKLALAIETHFDFISQNPKLPFFIISEIITNDERREMGRLIILPRVKRLLSGLSIAIDKEVAKGIIRPIEPIDLLLNVVSLNMFGFISKPMIQIINNQTEEEYKKFLEHRKKENVQLILKGLLA